MVSLLELMQNHEPSIEVEYRPLSRSDFALLARWLGAPHVTRWWRDSPLDTQGIEAKYGPRVDGVSPVEVFVIEVDSRRVGFIQRCQATEYARWTAELGVLDAIAIDYLIGEEDAVGKGIGTAAIVGFVGPSFKHYPQALGIIASPESTNIASCKALEKAGFSCVFEGKVEPDVSRSRVYLLSREKRT